MSPLIKRNGPQNFFMFCTQVISILLLLTTVAALIGIYQTHYVAGGATFGTTTASLSLIAFAISAHLWLQTLRR